VFREALIRSAQRIVSSAARPTVLWDSAAQRRVGCSEWLGRNGTGVSSSPRTTRAFRRETILKCARRTPRNLCCNLFRRGELRLDPLTASDIEHE
jgi:hypothetical protein